MDFVTLQKDMIAAMKAHDKERKDTISTLVSAAKKLAIDEGCRDDIKDELVDKAILKELKSVKEQIETCPDSRPELKAEYENRFNVINEYAPKMMSEEEVKAYIQANCAEALASRSKGLIMKGVMGGLKGKADGKVISKIVDELCK